MNIFKLSLAATLLISVVGCQSTAEEELQPVVNLSAEDGSKFMSSCMNLDSLDKGPVNKPLFVVGTFKDSNWKHVPKRKYSYKGHNIYQAVVDEKAGKYTMQYATELWFPQFTAKGKKMNVDELTILTFGGYGADTAVNIPEDGQYVWSLELGGKGEPRHVMVSKCK